MNLSITGSGSQMQGVGRAPDGRAVFVPGALPGEEVCARIVREKERFLEGKLLRVLTPSPDRCAPACPYAGQCGGCQAMHMRYSLTLSLKRERVLQALRRVGGVQAPRVEDTVGMENPFRARNKAEYAIENGRIGMRVAGSRSIIEIDDCLAQKQQSVKALRATRSWLEGARAFSGYLVTRVTGAGDVMCTLSADRAVRETDEFARMLREEVEGLKSVYFCRLSARPAHALDGRCSLVWGEDRLTDTLLGLSFSLHPQSFFQVNRQQAERLYSAALDMADLCGDEKVFDAYCGAGTITLCLARRAAHALGVEIVQPAIEDAIANAERNDLVDRTSFCCADAAREIVRLLHEGEAPDVVVMDPPRKGVDERLISALNEAKIPRLVYVSCDPGTLSRDVKRLSERYAFIKAQPVDLFPWTEHVETVVLMSRKDT